MAGGKPPAICNLVPVMRSTVRNVACCVESQNDIATPLAPAGWQGGEGVPRSAVPALA
jgi:hypothetical protein